jgi:glycosyltransferase involved in cell wall biosynthesis
MISPTILTIGPVDRNGGMGSVIRTYRDLFPDFLFIPTHDSSSHFKSLLYFKSLLKVLITLFQNKSILVIHIHVASYGSFYRKSLVVLLSKMFRKKVILHIHGGGFLQFYNQNIFTKVVVTRIFNLCNLIVCLSLDWRKRLSLIPTSTRFEVINNPVQEFKQLRIKRGLISLKLLFMGAITENKGIYHLIKYFSKNPYFLNHQIQLSIAGIGDDRTLKDCITAIDGDSDITYLGWVSNEDKESLLLAHDILILPSFYEGLPVSILEALSAQMPVISTAVGAIPDVVVPGKNGWLFDSSDFTQLDHIFNEIFDNPLLIDQYGQASKSIVIPYFADSVKLELNRLYNSLIQSK